MTVLDVAVLLAAFNGTQWIDAQITSILEQKNVNVKIFISVDPSTDDTMVLCQDWASRNSSVFVLPCVERFGGAARNFFKIFSEVNFRKFDYVCLADQDDIWLPDKLIRAHEMLLKTGADAYSSNVIAFWQDGRQQLIEKSQKQTRWDFLFEAAGPGCTYVFRKELACAIQVLLKTRWTEVQQVGLHDWFFYAYARANGYRWFIDDYAGMLYRQHEKNQVGVNKGLQAYLHRARKVLNGWGLAQSALIAELVGLGNDPFVRQWSNGSKSGLLSLSLHAWECRRRLRDKILFSLSCAALLLAGKRRA
ncbi:MAG: glycosyltransferase [Polaromonas sp.]|nr:glycosyltransferase [Polaromonas sp.]